jgi:rhodanese-related sulfurtransferase
MSDPMGANRLLAGAAGALALLALVAGDPYPSATTANSGLSQSLGLEIDEAHRVSAIQLAEWVRERRPGLRVLDLRTPTQYEEFNLPKAELKSLSQLGTTEFDSTATLVVYGDDAEAAQRGWLILRALGYPNVYYMKDGIGEWLGDIMNPTISPDASEGERAAFEKLAELSRYFGGLPRIEAMSKDQSTDEVLRRTMRRSCAF